MSISTMQMMRNGGTVSREGSSGERSARRPPQGRLITAATALAGLMILVGMWHRDESNLVAYEGLGYTLGIVGLTCMTVLLLYSVRKRARALRKAGRISVWFQIHMVLGLMGPVAILYHCNFQLGSLNSNVALSCALVVAASGVVGRVIYTRIHHGLSDQRTTVEDVREEVEQTRISLAGDGAGDGLTAVLEDFEQRVANPNRGLIGGAWAYLMLGHRCRVARRLALRCLRLDRSAGASTAAGQEDLSAAVTRFVGALRQAQTLHVYERFFALWHVLHLPLTFLLFVSAAVHVLAVHMY